MKKHKDRRKYLRTKCKSCYKTQESLIPACTNCGNAFFTEDSLNVLEEVIGDVDELEGLLRELEDPQVKHQNPYEPVDNAFKLIKKLRANLQIPGMENYIRAARGVLLPYKVGVLRQTVRANTIVLFLLALFPIAPLLFGWDITVTLLLLLPVGGWSYLLWRGKRELDQAKSEMEAALE
ncbi:MAG: hypothetical protein AAGN35_21585 [Bacteroidota bacterium]